ncbi:MAG: phosphoenolpyruvate protein kinase [Candidatus Rokuibacteriota bacterium]|nr:MAG: phosphoenolpyruvate protein kinase [Candidatus Rokubacteria bacterium]
MLRRSGLIAVIVGTVLTAINQGDVLLSGHWSPALAWKLPLTYAVPFIVATLGALGTGKMANRP